MGSRMYTIIYERVPLQGRKGIPKMMDKAGLTRREARKKREDELVVALKQFDTNVGAALGDTTGYTRFFKVLRREDGSWLAMIGGWDEEGAPVIAFGNGKSLLGAVGILGRALAADEWREDRYANDL